MPQIFLTDESMASPRNEFEMNTPVFGSGLTELYRAGSREYRRDDEIEVRTDHHCWIWKTLSDITYSFGREISVLDAGCGTGRHFHCLTNVNRLVGLDLSDEMLEAAQSPIRQELISAREIELRRGDVNDEAFAPGSFDFIYSIGMFGYGCELSVEALNRFYEWLSPDGKLFLDITDFSRIPFQTRVRKRVKKLVYPWLPARLQTRLDNREQNVGFFPVTRKQLGRMVLGSAFGQCEIYRRPCQSPCWGVAKLECLTGRGEISSELVENLQFRVGAQRGR